MALAFGDTIVHDSMSAGRSAITVGHHPRCTFVLPTGADSATIRRQVLVKKTELRVLEEFDGKIMLGGRAQPLGELTAAGVTRVTLDPEDWAVLWLRTNPLVRIVIQRVAGEPLVLPKRESGERPLFAATAVSAVAFALLLVISHIQRDAQAPTLAAADVDERFARVMFNSPSEPPPPEEPEVAAEDQPEERARKRAGGPEGAFGEPDRSGRSNIPRNPNSSMADRGKVGLTAELDLLAQQGTVGDLLNVGSQIDGLDAGQLILGNGSSGLSTRGSGAGGGGEGEGKIHGSGALDVGGRGVTDRKRKVKRSERPSEKHVSVKTGTASVKGQLSKELIDREVRRHRAQIRFCYSKQLTRFPTLSGKVTLRWVIAMDGSVKSAKVKASSLANTDAESCMVRALRSWKFPKPEGGVVQVDYPFIFDPK